MRYSRSREENEVVAALLWDAPRLYRGSEPARRFARVLDLAPIQDKEGTDQGRPLWLASEGLRLVLENEAEGANHHYQSLASADGVVRLLGLALLAWLPSAGTSELEAAADAVDDERFADFRSYYLLKLMTFAIDKGERAQAAQFWRDALESSNRNSGLFNELVIIGHNYFNQRPGKMPRRRRSQLVDLPWIVESTLSSLEEWLVEASLDRIPDRQTRTLFLGRQPEDGARAAELQAEWAGALWLLAPIRKQIALELFSQGPQNEEEAREAAAKLILGEVKNPREFVPRLETKFEKGTVDELIRTDLRTGRRVRTRGRFLELCLSVWDECSEETAAALLSNVNKDELGSPDATARLLFGSLAALVPTEWSATYSGLDHDLREKVLDAFPMFATEVLPRSTLTILHQDIARVVRDAARPSLNALHLFVAVCDSLEIEPDTTLLARAPAADRISLGWYSSSLRQALRLPAAVPDLISEVESQIVDAAKGRRGFTTRSSPVALAQCLTMVGDAPGDAVDALLQAAIHPRSPSDMRLQSLRALELLAEKGLLEEPYVERLEEVQEFGEQPFWDDVPYRVVNAARTFLLAHYPTRSPEIHTVASLARDGDWRVRALALEAAAVSFQMRSSHPEFAMIIHAGLFDETQSVARAAVRRVGLLPETELWSSVAKQLTVLMRGGERDTRRDIASAAAALKAADTATADALLALASRDKSWVVRHTARMGSSPR